MMRLPIDQITAAHDDSQLLTTTPLIVIWVSYVLPIQHPAESVYQDGVL
jgi:hypothetical protein